MNVYTKLQLIYTCPFHHNDTIKYVYKSEVVTLQASVNVYISQLLYYVPNTKCLHSWVSSICLKRVQAIPNSEVIAIKATARSHFPTLAV